MFDIRLSASQLISTDTLKLMSNDALMGPRKLQKQKSTGFSIQHNRWDWVKNKIKRFNYFFSVDRRFQDSSAIDYI